MRLNADMEYNPCCVIYLNNIYPKVLLRDMRGLKFYVYIVDFVNIPPQTRQCHVCFIQTVRWKIRYIFYFWHFRALLWFQFESTDHDCKHVNDMIFASSWHRNIISPKNRQNDIWWACVYQENFIYLYFFSECVCYDRGEGVYNS